MRWLSKKPIEGWNLKYGELNENILKEAYNHVVSLTQWDLLNEEMATLAVRAGHFYS